LTDNTALWTCADAHQYRYKVIVIEDCTKVHREKEPPGAKGGALRIIRNVLKADVLPSAESKEKYLKPMWEIVSSRLTPGFLGCL
jgi:nicotinamidase-related amidase